MFFYNFLGSSRKDVIVHINSGECGIYFLKHLRRVTLLLLLFLG